MPEGTGISDQSGRQGYGWALSLPPVLTSQERATHCCDPQGVCSRRTATPQQPRVIKKRT